MDLAGLFLRYPRTLLITVMMFKLGLLCTAAADKCLSSPCQNGATCLDNLDDYVCLCPRGPVWFMGRNCEELFDACITEPCSNCTGVLGTNQYSCLCPDGFTGFNCTEDVDECLSQPCDDVRSLCVNRANGYSCHCPLGLGGPACQDNVTTCSEGLCQNGGDCVDVPDTGFWCRCPAGYQGDQCETDIDECQSEPCQNGAICRDGVNGYQCFCVPGFQGSHCDLDINECASRPCQNNGTCVDEVDHYSCDCAAGFTGTNCQAEIDECEERPCQNGGTCLDHVAAYSCWCVDGFQGPDCEINIDECASAPCLNRGRCIDGVNSYRCDCEDTGFIGDHCQEDIPECASDPCQHGATCVEGISQYSCRCWPGYRGDHCEVDVDECEQNPCENGGRCYQRSNVLLYGTLPQLNTSSFSYDAAAGFICSCLPGFTGDNCSVNVDECASTPCQHGGSCQDGVNSYQCVCADGFTGTHCQVDIDECDSDPCQNGATCTDAANSYTCLCPAPEPNQEPWGGRDCEVRLVGCRQHRCQHSTGCVPLLRDSGEQGYRCVCSPGWAGDLCNTSTTFSFTSEGFVHVQMPPHTDRNGAEARDHVRGLHVQLRFRSTLPDMLLFSRGSEEHYASLELVGGSLLATVKTGKVLQALYPGPVNDGDWHQVTVSMDESLVLAVKCSTCEEEEEESLVKDEGYNHLFFLQPSSFQQLYVGGAPREYLSRSASKQSFIGCMEDLRVDHKLLLPQDLLREENQGLELGCNKRDWCGAEPCTQRGHCVDMWVRARCVCRRPYYGDECEKEFPSWTFGHENSSSYAAFLLSESRGENFSLSFSMRSLKRSGLLLQLHRQGTPYLTLYLKNGSVAIYSPHTTLISEVKAVTDGNDNPVAIKIQYGHVIFPKAGNNRALGNVSVEAGDVAYVGGLPAGSSMSAWGGNFKGCLQDIRLDNRHLTIGEHPEDVHIYQASAAENVIPGCQSDDSCKDEPCLNNGSCQITWNDFNCSCPADFSGRLCETRLWCVNRPCFHGAHCVDLPDGYECLTDAMFRDNALEFAANSSLLSPVTNITMAIRTRDPDGILLRASSSAEVFCLGLLNSSLLVKMDSGENAQLLAFTSDRVIADGAWHQIQLSMLSPVHASSRWRLSVDGQRVGDSFGMGGHLNFLNDSKLWLAEKYTGCIGEVRVGGVYLPLMNVPDAPQAAKFSRLGGDEPTVGCRGSPVCDSQPCLNLGECQDQFNEFNCSCTAGWEGKVCETEINECASGPCVYGTCEDLLADYRCDCDPGYAGKDCQEEVNNCLEFSCVNGGLCVESGGVHTCSCPPGFIGKRCQWRFPPVSCVTNADCLNGGVCVGGESGGNCTCKQGYTGARCETEIDECESNPCLNGATCLDRLNHFQCECVPGFSGPLCENDKDEQRERLPWLVVAIPLTTLCMLLAILVVFFLVMTARKKRQSEGTYSPSSQEVAGARLEMGSVLKVPPEERLI